MCISLWSCPSNIHQSESSVSNSPPSSRNEDSPIFILASNRDEFLARPTLDAGWHSFESVGDYRPTDERVTSKISRKWKGKVVPVPTEDPAKDENGNQENGNAEDDDDSGIVLSGRDLGDPSGGTWLAVYPHSLSQASTSSASPSLSPGEVKSSAKGRGISIGILTNIHDSTSAPPSTARSGTTPSLPLLSRGRLLRDWIIGRPSLSTSAHAISTAETSSAESRKDLAEDAKPGSNLQDSEEAEEWTTIYLAGLEATKDRYAGYNLVLFDITFPESSSSSAPSSDSTSSPKITAHYHTNRSPSTPSTSSSSSSSSSSTLIPPSTLDLGGISNSILSEPFVKVKEGEIKLNGILSGHEGKQVVSGSDLVEELFRLMSTSKPVTKHSDLHSTISVPLCTLPAIPSPTPLKQDSENNSLLAASVPGSAQNPTTSHSSVTTLPRYYATRLTTIILVYETGKVEFVERDGRWLDMRGGEGEALDGRETWNEGMVRTGGRPEREFVFQV